MANWYLETYGAYLRAIETRLYDTCAAREYVADLYWQMVQHHFGWDQHDVADPDYDLAHINGKRARALMVLLVAEAIDGAYTHAMPAAIAVELLHNFTLLHDDVMDVSATRRGRVTVWKKWNSNQAINAGDGLYTWAMRALTLQEKNPVLAMRTLMDAAMATVEGQIMDIGFEERMDVSADEYLTMIYNKSGALIEGSARLGALATTDDIETIDAYGTFAHNLGIAFQIQDDYLGIWGDEARTGKSATTDIEGKKKSYPVLIALDEASVSAQTQLRQIYAQDDLSASDVQTVLGILDDVDAARRTRDLTDRYFDQAISALDTVTTGNRAHAKLLELAQFLVKRDH
jgi:geranylgeranyl diphosphate synthase, type I